MSKAYSLTREERETIINRSEADETWNVYSSSPSVMRRLDKWAKAVDVQKMDGQIVSKEYEVPRQCVSIHRPRKGAGRPFPVVLPPSMARNLDTSPREGIMGHPTSK